MALQIDGPNSLITVQQADLTLLSPNVYELDTDAFRLELRGWEDSATGMIWTKTHDHNTQVTFAGTTYARQVIIVSPWQVTFEDTGGEYTVILVGSNNNIFDLANGFFVPTPGLTLIPTNSAGLIVTELPTSGLTPTESADLAATKAAAELGRKRHGNRQEIIDDAGTTYLVTYDDDGTTELERSLLTDADDNAVQRTAGSPIKRGAPT